MSAQDGITHAVEVERDDEAGKESRGIQDEGGTEKVVGREGTVGEKEGVGPEVIREGGTAQDVTGRKGPKKGKELEGTDREIDNQDVGGGGRTEDIKRGGRARGEGSDTYEQKVEEGMEEKNEGSGTRKEGTKEVKGDGNSKEWIMVKGSEEANGIESTEGSKEERVTKVEEAGEGTREGEQIGRASQDQASVDQELKEEKESSPGEGRERDEGLRKQEDKRDGCIEMENNGEEWKRVRGRGDDKGERDTKKGEEWEVIQEDEKGVTQGVKQGQGEKKQEGGEGEAVLEKDNVGASPIAVKSNQRNALSAGQ